MSGYLRSNHGVQGKAVQIVKRNEDKNCFELVSDEVKKLLENKKVKDKEICVISAAGAFRKGKSFLLNFIVNYLEKASERIEGLGNWLGDENSEVDGFAWRGGSERETTGIWAWNKVFILKKIKEVTNIHTGFREVSSIDEIAVLLLDTQGTFDSDAGTDECIAVFSLATLLSSTLVFNLSQNIQENDLQHLQLFAEYGRQAAQTQSYTGKPFQSLMFLVRDWQYPHEYKYGLEGGERFLNKKLAIKPEKKKQHQDLKDVRRGIEECFENRECCLLPYPGRKVATGEGLQGKLKLSDVDREFRNEVVTFIESTFSFDHLEKKKINGKTITCGDFVQFLKTYVEAFQGECVPSATTLVQTTANAHHLVALERAKSQFMDEILKECGAGVSYLDPSILEPKMANIKCRAEKTFNDYRKVGGQSMNEEYLGKLSNYMEAMCVEYTTSNANKANFFVKTMIFVSYIFWPITTAAFFVKIQGCARGIGMAFFSTVNYVNETMSKIGSGIVRIIEKIPWLMPSLPDLGIQEAVRNTVCTPLTLILIMFIFNLLSGIFGMIGLSEFSNSLDWIVFAASLMLCLWIFLWVSGRAPDVRQGMDDIVAAVWSSRQTVRQPSRQNDQGGGDGHGAQG